LQMSTPLPLSTHGANAAAFAQHTTNAQQQ